MKSSNNYCITMLVTAFVTCIRQVALWTVSFPFKMLYQISRAAMSCWWASLAPAAKTVSKSGAAASRWPFEGWSLCPREVNKDLLKSCLTHRVVVKWVAFTDRLHRAKQTSKTDRWRQGNMVVNHSIVDVLENWLREECLDVPAELLEDITTGGRRLGRDLGMHTEDI
jgi:hypothetical protein